MKRINRGANQFLQILLLWNCQHFHTHSILVSQPTSPQRRMRLPESSFVKYSIYAVDVDQLACCWDLKKWKSFQLSELVRWGPMVLLVSGIIHIFEMETSHRLLNDGFLFLMQVKTLFFQLVFTVRDTIIDVSNKLRIFRCAFLLELCFESMHVEYHIATDSCWRQQTLRKVLLSIFTVLQFFSI